MSIQSEINRIAGAKSDIADAIEDKGVTVPSGTKLDGMANLIGQISGGSGKLNSTQAADAYDPTATYAVGDKVSYAGNVYSCISAISTPEAWDSTHWDQVDPIQDQVDDVRNTLNRLALIGNMTAINQNGTYTKETVIGMTANHKVANWGLFSDANLTTPISPNNPPADITIAEEADGYVITIANYTSAFYMKPTFILPQNEERSIKSWILFIFSVKQSARMELMKRAW